MPKGKKNPQKIVARDARLQIQSRFSPVFQKCVVDVAERKLQEGEGWVQALQGAFRICRKSVGERRYGQHATKKDGTPVDELEQTRLRYQQLLVQHQLNQIRRKRLPSARPRR